MAVPDQTQQQQPAQQQPVVPPAQQPPAQPHPVRDAALAAVTASRLPNPPSQQRLTIDAIVQMTTALLTALRRFQNQREQAFQAEVRKEALAQDPGLGEVLDRVISRELGYEASFRANQFDRVQDALGPALAISDKDQRDEAVKQIFDAERRYTQQREQAVRVRVLASVRHYGLEGDSPDGAFWMLGQGVKQHTPDCVAMSGSFWPWSVLRSFQPPVHAGCACYLLGKDRAVGTGLMSEDDVRDPVEAAADAARRLRQAAALMREGVWVEQVERALIEERWLERFPTGTVKGGEFRPKVGGDAGSMLLRKMGLFGRGQRHENVVAGAWHRLAGKYLRVPRDEEWSRKIGGLSFRSPVGTTNVYRDGALQPQAAVSEGEVGRVHEMAEQARHARRISVHVRRGAPLQAGDGPSALLSMGSRGWEQTHVQPLGEHSWALRFRHRASGATARAQVGRDGVRQAEWDTAPFRSQKARKLGSAPKSWAEHVGDALAWADELGVRYGSHVRVGAITTDPEMSDHAGFHSWEGNIALGKEVRPDIERAAQARAQGRQLTDDEKRGVYSAYWATAHEVSHGINPMQASEYGGAAANLEEALAEEFSHILARERLTKQGQGDVVKWADAHPEALAVIGGYLRERGALGDILDQAGIKARADRLGLLSQLKFETPVAQRMNVLGALLNPEDPAAGELRVRRMLFSGSLNKRSALHSWGTDFGKMIDKAWKEVTGAEIAKSKGTAKPAPWKPPPVVLGGTASVPLEQGPIPSFEHIPLTLGSRGPGSTSKAKDVEGGDWLVEQHGGDRNHVAADLLANAVYRTLGVRVPVEGSISTPGGPDFSQVPDALGTEPELPKTGRLSTGVLLRDAKGNVTVVEPRNHYGGYVHTFSKGGVEPGLSPQQNALKELWEETGLHAHITGVLGDYEGDMGVTRFYTGVQTGGTLTVSDETQAVKSVKPKEAVQMLNRERDQKVLKDLLKKPVAKGQFPDKFPPVVPGQAVAYERPDGKGKQLKGPTPELARDYMVDALVGNWDPYGKWGDNVLWDKDGSQPIRVNHGSTFEYRPGGGSKEYGPAPVEAWMMLRRGQAAGVVDSSDDELRAQAGKIAGTLTADKIDALVDAAPFTDQAMRERARAGLVGRVQWMREYADGETDMPEPASGAEARGILADGQADFQLFPEEEQAISDYAKGGYKDLADYLSGDKKKPPSADVARIVKHMDNVIKDTRTADDVYVYVPLSKAPGPGYAGQTIKQRVYTLATTDEDAARENKGVMRVFVPADSRVFYRGESPGDGGDVILPRGARMKLSNLRDEGGVPYVDAQLQPYEYPPTLYHKPYSYSVGGKGHVPLLVGDTVQVKTTGRMAEVLEMKPNGSAVILGPDGKSKVTMPRATLHFVKGKPSQGVKPTAWESKKTGKWVKDPDGKWVEVEEAWADFDATRKLGELPVPDDAGAFDQNGKRMHIQTDVKAWAPGSFGKGFTIDGKPYAWKVDPTELTPHHDSVRHDYDKTPDSRITIDRAGRFTFDQEQPHDSNDLMAKQASLEHGDPQREAFEHAGLSHVSLEVWDQGYSKFLGESAHGALPNYGSMSLEHLEDRHSQLMYKKGRWHELYGHDRKRHMDAIVHAIHKHAGGLREDWKTWDAEHELGVTPFRGRGKATGDDYYATSRYKGFENELRRKAAAEHVEVHEVEHVGGVWDGGSEPSARVVLRDGDDAVHRVMDHLGAKYNQDAVLRFKPGLASPGTGGGGRYRSETPVDPELVGKALHEAGLGGATQLSDGRVQVVDMDGSDVEKVRKFVGRTGAKFVYTAGHGELRFKGQHYGVQGAAGGVAESSVAEASAGAIGNAGGVGAGRRDRGDVHLAEAPGLSGLAHDVSGEARDPHGRWAKGMDDAVARLRATGLHVEPPDPQRSKMKPEDASKVADAIEAAMKQYPILSGANPDSGKLPLKRVVFLSAGTPIAKREYESGPGPADDRWPAGILAANGKIVDYTDMVINDLHKQSPGDTDGDYPNPLSAASQSGWDGVTWHELGHAIARAAGIESGTGSEWDQQQAYQNFLDKYGIGFDDARAVSEYATSSPAEAMGEFVAMEHTPGFREQLPADTGDKIDRMMSDLRRVR